MLDNDDDDVGQDDDDATTDMALPSQTSTPLASGRSTPAPVGTPSGRKTEAKKQGSTRSRLTPRTSKPDDFAKVGIIIDIAKFL